MLRLTSNQDCHQQHTLALSAGTGGSPAVVRPAESTVPRSLPGTSTSPASSTTATGPVNAIGEVRQHDSAAAAATAREEVQNQAGPEMAVVSGLLRIAQRIRSILNQGLADSGLNEIRLTVMQVLHESSQAGCSQSELADALQQSESSVSTLVERMRSDGLLYRLRSNADRRKRVLMLTAEGRDLLEQVEAVHAPRMRKLLSVLPGDDVNHLRQLLENLADGLAGHQQLLPEAESRPSRSSAA